MLSRAYILQSPAGRNYRQVLVISAIARTGFRAASTTTTLTSSPLHTKILIANRGEIACRIIKTAKRLGVKTVAVYSEADQNAMHVQMADEAYLIGPAPSAESYLKMDKIIDVAKKSGAQAIHPGYGFLSENAAFAEQVSNAGLTFIGPPVQAIIDMGSKSASKIIMENAKVPCVPGYHGEDQSIEKLKSEAKRIGFPVLIKAIKGGGGKGMRLVDKEQDFEVMLESARREAVKSFGDDKVLVEKYVQRPRHVEVQVFADTHGNAVYLFERDCSVQRRHQKVLEEAPAPGLTPELRASLGAKAVAAAKAVNYVGAGTVEFILDTDDNKFYFMEMNTRLQVEHPITEMITSTDLVEWQLQVAAGNTLPKFQNQLQLRGHAFEARVYAENPNKGFLPDTGRLVYMKTPEESANVRVETGVRMGDEVSVYYDPMISKLVVHGNDRAEALRILLNALEIFHVAGPTTNIPFLHSLASHPAFQSGDVDTNFIPTHTKDLLPPPKPTSHTEIALAALSVIQKSSPSPPGLAQPYTPWTHLPGLRLNHSGTRTIKFIDTDGGDIAVRVHHLDTINRNFNVKVTTKHSTTEFLNTILFPSTTTTTKNEPTTTTITAQLHSTRHTTTTLHTPTNITLLLPSKTTLLTHPPLFTSTTTTSATTSNQITTPMPCKISSLNVKKGDKVIKGQVVVVLEAMKMEHVVRAPMDGVVERVWVREGELVGEGKVVVGFVEKGE